MNKTILFKTTLDFCKVVVYQDYVYIIMDEGVTVQPSYNDILVSLVNTYYKNRNFVYVTHRIHSYSVDPTIYLKTAEISNLVGFIIIQPSPNDIMIPKIEKLFFNKPLEVCETVEEARAIGQTMLNYA